VDTRFSRGVLANTARQWRTQKNPEGERKISSQSFDVTNQL